MRTDVPDSFVVGYSAQASPASTSSLVTVLIEAPVTRLMDRREEPSTSSFMMVAWHAPTDSLFRVKNDTAASKYVKSFGLADKA